MEDDKTGIELRQIAPVPAMDTPKTSSKIKSCIKTNLLTILTVCGVILGGLLGFLLRQFSDEKWTEREIMYINFFGDLFLRMLKSLILPLIVSSLISAIARLDITLSGKIAARAIGYYITTTFCAVIIGIILVVSIKPGEMGDKSSQEGQTGASNVRNVTTVDTLLDLIRNLFPPNLIQACTEQTRTVLVPPTDPKQDINSWKIEHEYTDGTNILGLVVFSTVMGITLAKLGEKGEPLAKCFEALSEAMLIITKWVIYLSPLGVLFLVASKVLEIENPEELIGRLGMYFLTVIVGLLIQGIVIIPLTYVIIVRKNPFTYLINLGQALATAFGTSSSSATLPLTLQCVVEKNGVDSRIARFALPIGATINMDGTALYEAVAAIFIAQIRSIDLSIGHLVAISITATAASIGAAGIPQAGLVTMVMVLDTVGLPAEDVTLILAIDWLLDRFRTVLNVMGDAFGAGIVYHLSKGELISTSNHI
ncbi:excitatory amino acid transporter 3-like isoform X2 [Photinus pyralis]|uniref:excitatory amino acid transporter 3-like isoform X2 n=1 Tax=Photinus pyralis TaxID=7054 RepID=UPI001267675A|nr:excitatory amino acid transporter 3-like isoform X2 [Photinus pyralis]